MKCFNCKQIGHFSWECRAQGGQNSNNYQKYKSKEAGKDGPDSKAMVVVDGSIGWDKQTEKGNIEPRSLENFGMIARIKIESNADSDGEVVSANDAIPAGVSVSAGNVAAAVVSPYDELEGQPIYNKFASVDHMKAVPPPLTGNYMPPSNILDIDESQMVYEKKATDSSKIKINDDSISYSHDFILFNFSDRSSKPFTNDFQTCDSSVECSRPNHSDHDFIDSISRVSVPISESKDTIVIDCDRQEDFPSVCTSSIETDVKSSKTLSNKLAKRNAEGKGKLGKRPTGKPVHPNRPKPISAGQPHPVFAGQPNLVSAGDGILGPRPLNIQPKSWKRQKIKWFLFTSAGRVTFCWLFPIPAGDLVSAGHMLFLLSYSNIFHLCHSYSQIMAEFHFNIDHNKVAYLQKPTESLASEVSLPDGARGLVATIDGTAYTRIATLEARLKATKILHRDTLVLFAKRIKKLESKLKTKKRKLVLSDSENEEEARQFKELDALLDLANVALHAPTRARATTIIYKRLKKQKSSFGLDFTDVDIPAGGLDFAGGLNSAGGLDSAGGLNSAGGLDSADVVDSAGGLTSASISIAAGPTVPAEPSSPLRDPSKGKAAHPTLSAELLGADVSEDTFSVRMVELMNRQRKAIVKMKAKVKREKPMTPAQQKEFMRTFSSAIYTTGWTWKFVRGLTDDQLRIEYDKIRRAVDLATAKDQHQHLKRSGETLESLESKKLKSSHSTSQPAELQETTSVSAGATIAAGDPIPAITFVSKGFSVSASSSIPAATPIAAGVSTTAGAFGSASEASVPVIELFDSPPKDTSLPLDPKTDDLDEPLRKSLRKKSIARKRTLPSPSKPKSAALHFDEDDPEAAFKRADGTVKRFSTMRELMYWAGRADLMVLYGLVSDKYKTERATGIGLGLWMDLRTLITAREERDASIIWDDHDQWQIRSWRFYAIPAIHVLETEAGDNMYMFVDKKYPLTPATLQRMLNYGLKIDRDPSDYLPFLILLIHQRFNTALMTIYYWKLDNTQVTIQFRGGLLGIVIPAARVFYFCWQVFIPAGDLFLLAVLHYCC
nr:aminoacyl-tRNA synthetase, class 1a, anticodon-binding [Tanacetum cinerariifolium]